jgi:hypothetical protein
MAVSRLRYSEEPHRGLCDTAGLLRAMLNVLRVSLEPLVM